MKRKIPIKDLKSLKLAQMERRAELIERELTIKQKADYLWERLSSFSLFTNHTTDGWKTMLKENVSPISHYASNLLINKVIKPKSEWLRSLSTIISAYLIEKYSGTLQFLLNTLLKDESVETKSKN